MSGLFDLLVKPLIPSAFTAKQEDRILIDKYRGEVKIRKALNPA